MDVSRRELEALKQRPDESVTSFISRWREKIAHIIDRPSEYDQISMIMRSLQPRFTKHLMGFPQTDFGSLVQALYGIEEGISRGLWADSSPSDSKVGTETIRCWCHWHDKTHVPTSPSVSKAVFRHSLLDDTTGSVQTNYSFHAGWAYLSTSATTTIYATQVPQRPHV